MIRIHSEAPACTPPHQAWQAGFLAFLPAIQRHAQVAFGHLDPEAREEAVQEVVAYALVTYLRLAERNKLDLAYPAVLARYGVARVKDGRQVATRLNTNDVLSPYAQRRKGFRVGRLDHFDLDEAQWREVLVEDHRTPVPDQAAFRIDFPAWLESQPPRKRRITEALAVGHSPGEVARGFALSPARVSQLRRELAWSWQRFHGEEAQRPGGHRSHRAGPRVCPRPVRGCRTIGIGPAPSPQGQRAGVGTSGQPGMDRPGPPDC